MCLLSVAMWASCDSDSTAAPEPIRPTRPTVNLTFSVGVTESVDSPQSRTLTETSSKDYFEREANRYEKIHSLRIIILRPAEIMNEEGKLVPTGEKEVEHNKYFRLAEDGTVFYDDLTFEVIGDEKKTIYILANEEGVNANLPEGAQAIDFDGIAPVGEIYTTDTIESVKIYAAPDGLAWNNSQSIPKDERYYIPMAEVYDEIQIIKPEHEIDEQKIGPFFITRASVKFSFSIRTTEGPDDLFTLKKIKFRSLADREYYLPNHATYHTDKDIESGVVNGSGLPDPELAGRFITAYDVPADVSYKDFDFDLTTPISITNAYQTISPLLYFCESKLDGEAGPTLDPTTGEAVMPSLTGMPYSVGITIAHTTVDDKGQKIEVEHTFDPVPLDNLPILPRNTHVRVNMSLTAVDLTCVVELVPYTGIWLNPNFGIADRE